MIIFFYIYGRYSALVFAIANMLMLFVGTNKVAVAIMDLIFVFQVLSLFLFGIVDLVCAFMSMKWHAEKCGALLLTLGAVFALLSAPEEEYIKNSVSMFFFLSAIYFSVYSYLSKLQITEYRLLQKQQEDGSFIAPRPGREDILDDGEINP